MPMRPFRPLRVVPPRGVWGSFCPQEERREWRVGREVHDENEAVWNAAWRIGTRFSRLPQISVAMGHGGPLSQ